MQDTDVYCRMAEIFREVFRRDIELRPGLAAKDVAGWDSFKQVEIIIASERAFSFKLTSKDVDSLSNVGDLVRVILAKTRVG